VPALIQFGMLGLATGSLYVLLALGLVIIYRGSGVVNFAHGAIAMVAGFLYWYLTHDAGFPVWAAVPLSIVAAGCVGLLIHYGVMRPLREAAALTRIIATLAVMIILQEGMALIYNGPALVVAPQLPTGTVTLFGAAVGVDKLIILGGVLVISALLGAFYRYTQFGRMSAAATQNPQALAGLGHSPSLVLGVNWFIGAAMAGAAGVMLAPIENLSVTDYTLLVVPALAAAVVGSLSSFPLALAGGLVIGVAQSEVSRYVTAPGWTDAVPFLAMIILLLLRGERLTSRTQASVRLPRIGTGRLRPGSIMVAFVLGVLVIETVSAQWNGAITTSLGTALIVLSLVVVTGYSGQLSLAQFAMAGWGAWIAGLLAKSGALPFLPAVLVGAAATLPLGLVVGAITLRSRGVNLAIVTLGLAVALNSLVFNNPASVGDGTFIIPEAKIGGLDVGSIVYPQRYSLVVLIAFTLACLAVANIRRGRSGRRLVAVRSNERAAASLGVSVKTAKLAAFGWSGLIAGLGGALLAFQNPNIDFSSYDPLQSVNVIGDAVVGGIGLITGPLAGSQLGPGSVVSTALDNLGNSASLYLPFAGGVLLAVTLLTQPDGIAAKLSEQAAFLSHHIARLAGGHLPRIRSKAASSAQDASGTPHTVPPRELSIDSLSVSFSGVKALTNVGLTVGPGEIVGLIGPNGAGKTTLIDAATGFIRTDRGRITLAGEDITRRTASARARRGLARSFQSLELFDDLTVLDNLRTASEPSNLGAYLTDALWPAKRDLTVAAKAAVSEFRLAGYLDNRPSELPYGVRRLVGIARCVAANPSVVALDEPAAGLDSHEAAELGVLLRNLAREWGMGILLVEHNVELVLGLCDRVYALDFGHVIADGTPGEIRDDPAVVSAYLGTGDDHADDDFHPHLADTTADTES